MDQIPAEFWWLAVCLNSILIPGGSALGAWLLYKFWPAIQEGRTRNTERRESNENAALGIARETIDWSRQEFADQQRSVAVLAGRIDELIKIEEHRAKLFTIQNGILSEIGTNLAVQQTKITQIVDILKGDRHDDDR